MRFLNLKASPVLRYLNERFRSKEERSADQEAMVNALRALCSMPEWKLYKQMLDLTVSNSVQGMLSSESDSQVHYYRGYVTGLLHSAQIPENLISQEDNARSRQHRSDTADAARAAAAKSSLFGTPAWPVPDQRHRA